MEKIKFNPSKEPTVGVEVESQIVDKSTGDLVNIAENIVNGYGKKRELNMNYIFQQLKLQAHLL